jgi:hypothetical protein
MARPTDEFLLAWESLAGEATQDGWRSIPVTSSGSCYLMAARRFPGNGESLLAHFPSVKIPVAEKLPEGYGFTIERVDPLSDGKIWLALTRKESGSTELFMAMVGDMVGVLHDMEATSGDERLLAIFLGRVRAWQEFMRKDMQGLEPEAEIGLIGELSFLAAMLDAGIPATLAMESWVGPLDGIQDFELGTGAVEVKTTLSASGFPAKIGSLDQLDDSIRPPLFLAGVRLSQTESGRKLPEFLEHIRGVLKKDAEALRLFSNRLLAAGFFDSHVERYTRRFAIVSISVIEVGDCFPRLTHGTVPIGIRSARYEIDFDRATGENLGPMGAFKKLGVL